MKVPIKCSKCGKEFFKDITDFITDEQITPEGSDSTMGSRVQYEVSGNIKCPKCSVTIILEGYIYEYPTEAFYFDDLTFRAFD